MGIKICPKCNGKVSTSRNICIHCGYVFPSSKMCPDCGEAVDISVIECPVCGYLFNKAGQDKSSSSTEIAMEPIEQAIVVESSGVSSDNPNTANEPTIDDETALHEESAAHETGNIGESIESDMIIEPPIINTIAEEECAASTDAQSESDISAVESTRDSVIMDEELPKFSAEENNFTDCDDTNATPIENPTESGVLLQEKTAADEPCPEKTEIDISEKKTGKCKTVCIVIAAIIVVCVTAFFLMTKVIIPNRDYKAAEALMAGGQYQEASDAFAAMGNYKDAADRVKEPFYVQGMALMNAGDYEAAIAAFTKASGFGDSLDQIANCRTAITDKEYEAALALMDSGDYLSAYEAFGTLNGYKDSGELQASIKANFPAALLRNAAVGDIISYGSYEQDNDLENGQEEIEWIVLDKVDDRILVISKYGLDCKPYNESYVDVTWETCSLRDWLNSTFLSSAFTEAERKYIPIITITADENPEYNISAGNNTSDMMFLLSIPDAMKYFSADDVRMCEPTIYAVTQSVYTSSSISENGETACNWWLRSPGSHSDYTACTRADGSIYLAGFSVTYNNGYIRPSMWINLSSDTTKYLEDEYLEGQYVNAVSLMNSGDYAAAYESFANLADYKDCAQLQIECLSLIFSTAEIGDTVCFGNYEQDNVTSNGRESIEWIVLEKEEDKILLISRYVLDCQPYNTSDANVTWESCSLRDWLNDVFLNTAFTATEQSFIPTVTVSADKNPNYKTAVGNNTQDQVFLLSIIDVEKYIPSDLDRKCVPTAYAVALGVGTRNMAASYSGSEETCKWWLRTPGESSDVSSCILQLGSVYYHGETVNNVRNGVRPALWINITPADTNSVETVTDSTAIDSTPIETAVDTNRDTGNVPSESVIDYGSTDNSECEHFWTKATCQTASYCIYCGAANPDSSLGEHNWTGGTCQKASICSYCGAVSSTIGHDGRDTLEIWAGMASNTCYNCITDDYVEADAESIWLDNENGMYYFGYSEPGYYVYVHLQEYYVCKYCGWVSESYPPSVGGSGIYMTTKMAANYPRR